MPTNGIILLAKTVNACATNAIGPILRDDSHGLIPFLWFDAEIPSRRMPKVRAASELCCDQKKEKGSQKARKGWQKGQHRWGPTNGFPWQAGKPCGKSSPTAALGLTSPGIQTAQLWMGFGSAQG